MRRLPPVEALALYDEKGNPRVMLTTQNLEAANKTQATLFVTKEGPILDIYDQNNNDRVGMGIFDGVPKLAVADANQRNTAELLNTADGPMLRMSDGNQRLRVNLSVSPTVGASLGLTDNNEKVRALIAATSTVFSQVQTGFVGLYDKDTNVIWQAP